MRSLMLQTSAIFLLPFFLLFSFFLLLRGHNQPGGGFSGGLVGSAAFVLYGLAYNAEMLKKILLVKPVKILAVGLIIALFSGAISIIFYDGAAFTSIWWEWNLPNSNTVKFGSSLLFDIGVYLAVVGSVLAIIISLLEED